MVENCVERGVSWNLMAENLGGRAYGLRFGIRDLRLGVWGLNEARIEDLDLRQCERGGKSGASRRVSTERAASISLALALATDTTMLGYP